MLNRRQAVTGYVTFVIARRLARRAMRRRLQRLRGGHPDRERGQMGRKSKGAQAAAERAAAIVETIRPIVNRAMSDPELHDALKKAFATGRDIGGDLSGSSATEAARRIAADRKLQRRVETSARDLQRAVGDVIEPPKRRGRLRRALGKLAILGAVAGGAAVVLRKLRGGGGDA